MKRWKKKIVAAMGLWTSFLLWTAAVCRLDVQAIGPRGSEVGLATLNRWFHRVTGVHFGLYNMTDWLGLVPVGMCMGFGILGLAQWIGRRSIRKVDFSILTLGGFYLVVMAAYLIFEGVAVNFRPVLIGGYLEASYPSSTTLLVLCIMPTAILQLKARIKNRILRRLVLWGITVFTVFMVVGRLISGVHWLTDIIGGILLSAGLVMSYAAVCEAKKVD